MSPSARSILVLHEAIEPDARADERDTLIQAGEVAAALQRLGFRVNTLQTSLNLDATLATIRQQQPDAVFNLVESLGGDGRMIYFVPALLASAGLAFTGSASDAIFLSSQKQLAKNWMRHNGILTPASLDSDGSDMDPGTCWIVKSVWEHASFGLDDGCVVRGSEAAAARIGECIARFGGEWFAEQFVAGREFNISVLERDGAPVILPVAEIEFSGFAPGKPEIVGYAAKWDEDSAEYRGTPRVFPSLSPDLATALEGIVQQCWESFGLQGYARVDIRVDEAGIPWVLEINANPCLSRDAGFAVAAGMAGIAYDQMISQIVDSGLTAGLPARFGGDENPRYRVAKAGV